MTRRHTVLFPRNLEPLNMPNVQERRVTAPMERREAALQPTSWNPERRTIDVVWTTGARGVKFDWNSGELVDEELETGSSNVRLGRLNGGAPVLNTHQRFDLASQIGVVVPGSARMDRGAGLATLQLSDRADLAPIVSDIAAGIVRNLSVGYTVHAYEIEQRRGQRPLYRAVDWEPFEISFVPVPFDAAAQVRSGTDATLHPLILRETIAMPDAPATPANPALSTAATPSWLAENRGIDANQPASVARLREIVTIGCEGSNFPADRQANLVLDFAERGLTDDQARQTMLQVLADRQRRDTINAGARAILGIGETFDNPDFHARAIEDALFSRMSGRPPSDQARQFMGMTMVQIAGEMVERAGGRVNRMSPNDVLEAAAWNRVGARAGFLSTRASPSITTSDFPDLLTAAGNRYLLDVFAAAASPIKALSRERSARDFREISGLQLSSFGPLREVLEDGEIKHGSFASRKETFRLRTFGEQFSLSRQAIINDDLGAFGDPMRIMARSAAETEAKEFADLINSNPVMSDGKTLFHADHGNLAGVGAAPAVATLDSGRVAMRSQKDGDVPIAAAPRYILASPARETAIEQLLVATTVPTTINDTNPFAGKLVPMIDPRLTANPWYLFADPQLAPVLEHAYLDGQSGPHVEMRDHWNTMGQSFRVYMDFGAGVVDYRGAYKNPGA